MAHGAALAVALFCGTYTVADLVWRTARTVHLPAHLYTRSKLRYAAIVLGKTQDAR